MAHLSLKKRQLTAERFVFDTPRCALWMKMGGGKTAVTLSVIKHLVWLGEVRRVLIIAPKRVAKHTWRREIEKWDEFKDLTYTVVVDEKEKDRKRLLLQATDITLINYEHIPWLVRTLGDAWPFDMLVLDEARIKNPTGVWLNQLKKVSKYLKRVVELTGTPAPNSYMDLYGPLYMIDHGKRLGRTVTAYRKRWFYLTGGDARVYTPHAHSMSQINDSIEDVCLSLDAENDVPKVESTVEVFLPDMASYKELEKEFFLKLERGDIEPANAAVASGKCLQYCGGAVFHHALPGEPRMWEEVHTAKLDALESVIEEAGGEPVMVAYWYSHELIRLRERFPQGVALRDCDDPEEAWNSGRIKLAFIHPQGEGEGLNLQDHGRILVWFALTWNLKAYEQTVARLWRQGQKNTVYIYHLVAVDTVEEDVVARLVSKASVQDSLMARMSRSLAA